MKKFYLILMIIPLLVSCGEDNIAEKKEIEDLSQNYPLNGTTQNHDWVNLGLPSGTLWATCNVGANTPEDYGDYFSWGETSPKSDYSQENYKFYKYGKWQKYFTENSNYNGIIDNITQLEPLDDAAFVNWGSDWSTPSLTQVIELLEGKYTTIEYTSQNNVSGILIRSKKNSTSIFLPSGGYYNNASHNYSKGNLGNYWTRTLEEYVPINACYFSFNNTETNWWNEIYRFFGLSVRPVRNL